MTDRLQALVKALQEKKVADEAKKTAILAKYKKKILKLTLEERIDRIEELLGLK